MANTPQATQKTVKILVVEDSPTQLEALRFLLEESGFAVVVATNGREGLAAAKASMIDLVISDIVMPEMDGYTLCKTLRADETLRHLPVILLTSLSDPRDVIQGLESGANNFICKPYEDRALLARVQNVLANLEIRKDSSSEMGINIFFAGQRFFITADRLQILDLLLSTYENAVNRNSELMRTRDELRILNEQLEVRVAERTAALAAEVVERQASQEREHHLNRLLRTIRNINQLIVCEKDPARLIEQACELLVKTDGYRAAWIVLYGKDSPISLVAQAGWGKIFEPFSERLRRGLLPPCVAEVRSTESGIATFDLPQACHDCTLTEPAASSPSCVARIGFGSEDFGLLHIHFNTSKKIDDDETGLLLEVAHDLGFAMYGIITDKARKESEEKLQVITNSAPDAVILKDGNGRISYWNPASERVFGYSQAEALGHNANELLIPEIVRPQYNKVIEEFRQPGVEAIIGKVVELTAKHKDGHEFPIEMAISSIRMADNFWVSTIIRDISDRTRAEEQIRNSLKEKEVLLREIHHRVKNNLQIISGLLTMQADQSAGKSLEEIFQDSQDRIHSIALIHEKLYSSHNLSEIAFDDYLRVLVGTLFASYHVAADHITAAYKLDPVFFNIETAMPLGLIVNELVTNALKHAFPGRKRGEIRIELLERPGTARRAPTCELTVANNGKSLPPGFKPGTQKSLGMHLVMMLADQLQAKLKISRKAGTRFTLIIPMGNKNK